MAAVAVTAISLGDVLTAANLIGPFMVAWVKDAWKKLPVIEKYALALGSDVAVPFSYTYYYLRTYKGFDAKEFKKIFVKTHGDKYESEEAADAAAESMTQKVEDISKQLRLAFLQKKGKEELSEKELKHLYLIPRGEDGKIAYDRLLEHIKKTSADYARLNVPMMELLSIPVIPGMLGKALNMPEEELGTQSSFSHIIDGAIAVIEKKAPAEGTPEKRQLDTLKQIKQEVAKSGKSGVRAMSAEALQIYVAQAAAEGDQEGVELAEKLLAKTHFAEKPEGAQTAPVSDEAIPALEDRKKVRYGQISDPKVKDWARTLNPNLTDESVVDLPAFMAPEQEAVAEDIPADVRVELFGQRLPEPVKRTAPPPLPPREPELKEVEGAYEGGNDEPCNCMPARFIAIIIVLILIMAVIASLPRYLTLGLMVLLAAWLVWESQTTTKGKAKE